MRGCEAGIIVALNQAGLKNIKVDHTCQEVSFEGDKETAIKVLNKMGYPEASPPRAKSITKKAKSYISCAMGKTKNSNKK